MTKIKPRATRFLCNSGDFVLISSCPVCDGVATMRFDERFGYTCACDTLGCPMGANRASYMPTDFDAILNWNGLALAIDIARSKGEVDETVLSRIFGPIPDDPDISDESGSESE